MARRKVMGDNPFSIMVKFPAPVGDALHEAAAAEYVTDAEYIRRAVIERLRKEGFLDAPMRGDVD